MSVGEEDSVGVSGRGQVAGWPDHIPVVPHKAVAEVSKIRNL